jgi:hypothetical protein
MSPTYGHSSLALAALYLKFSLVPLLIAFQFATTAPVQRRSFSSVRSSSGGRLCIQDTPSVAVKVSSLAQCAGDCVTFQSCSRFNIFDDGSLVSANCQLLKTGELDVAWRPIRMSWMSGQYQSTCIIALSKFSFVHCLLHLSTSCFCIKIFNYVLNFS